MKQLLGDTVKKHMSLIQSGHVDCTRIHLSSCMDMHSFTHIHVYTCSILNFFRQKHLHNVTGTSARRVCAMVENRATRTQMKNTTPPSKKHGWGADTSATSPNKLEKTLGRDRSTPIHFRHSATGCIMHHCLWVASRPFGRYL